MKYFIKYNQKGFTLIETLFAILIFSTALVSLIAIAGRGISAADSAREQTVAHYLAQEGIEAARNMRDTNWLAHAPWDANFNTCTQNAPCKVDYQGGNSTPLLATCGNPSCPLVQESNGDFVDGPSTSSPYTRTIYVTPQDIDQATTLPREYEVVSTVSWKSKTIQRTVTLQTLLKEWR
jgi:prepilin-type N-terminal cleavage/methylation domain-containing protein